MALSRPQSNEFVTLNSPPSPPSPPLKRFKASDPYDSDVKHEIDEYPKLTKYSDKPPTTSNENWREDCVGVRDIFQYALTNNVLTDVTFLVGEKSQVFHAHRLVLALGSPIFEAMFFGALAEKDNSIKIPDVEPEGFKLLLGYMYSERVYFKDYVSAIKTAFAAEKYCVTSLKERCESFLIRSELTPSNVWIFLENALYLNLPNVRDRCSMFLKHNTETALQHESFLEAHILAVKEFLSLDTLQVNEAKLLDIVLSWAQYRSSDEEGNSFKSAGMILLRYIRFSALKADEFVNCLEVKGLNEILNDKDAMVILKHIIKPSLCPLPDWCCSKPPRKPTVVPNLPGSRQKLVTGQSSDSRGRAKSFTVRCRTYARTSPTASSRTIYSSSSSSESSPSSESSSSSTDSYISE